MYPEFHELVPLFNKANQGGFMRLGQWFLNTYDPLADNMELFYCTDQKHAMDLIRLTYYK